MQSRQKLETPVKTTASFCSNDSSLASFDLARSCAGLDNLTNTCYMNSSIVCLANVPVFRDYFLSGRYEDSLQVNKKLTEKTNGEFAQQFRSLLADLWDGRSKSLRPRRFKDLTGQLEERFAGYDQHDAMEFLEFAVDTLREDCNRVKGKKPYMERNEDPNRKDTDAALEYANYCVMRNDSFIDDLFVGFTKRLTLCPDKQCGKETFIFDPFLSVKLPLNGPHDALERRFEVSVVALGRRDVSRHIISVDKRGDVLHLKREASRAANLNISKCLLAEVSRNALVALRDDAKLTTIRAVEKLVIYEFTAKDVKAIQRADPRGFVESVEVDDDVIVANDFLSANSPARQLCVGTRGRVLEIDDDGDARIHFVGIDQKQWVFRVDFKRMLKLNSDSRKICLRRNKAFSLPEVMRWPEFSSDFRRIRDYWQCEMVSTHSACTIYFRKGTMDNGASSSSFFGSCKMCASRAGRRGELVGFPLLLSSSRVTTSVAIREAIRNELLQRLGIDCRSGWSLYQAASGKDAWQTNVPVSHAEETLLLGERAHFVVQLGREYAEVLQDFEDIAAVRLKEGVIPIETCFEWLCQPEELSGDNKIKCEGCKNMVNVFTKNELWSLPPVLVLHLKRFYCDGYYTWRKLDRGVSFPLEGLDLTRYSRGVTSFPEGACLRAGTEVEIEGLQSDAGRMLNGQRGTAMYLDTSTKRFCVRMNDDDPSDLWKKVQPKNLKPVPTDRKPDVQPWIYDLVSLAKHLGRPGFGHYVAYARSSEDGLWRLYDDDDVREVEPETVESEHSGCYVLVYLRRDLRPPAWGPAKERRL